MSNPLRNQYYAEIEKLLREVEQTQADNVTQAARLLADSIMSGGMLQAFGSGHSLAAAIEITGRAGGLIPAKLIKEPSFGLYELIEGVGREFCKKLDVKEQDFVVIISNSGRNPLPIEIAVKCKEAGAKVVAVTSLEASKKLTPRHSGGKNLWQYADVILDNRVQEGDASIELPGLPVKVCGTSSVSAAVMLNAMVLESIQIMLQKGYTPPIYMSSNLDGGLEFNDQLTRQYFDRLYHV